ncbi:MAG: hypothetical protein IPP41_11965 [Rhodocyclaceae bacterium]|nr:hypothetical protein [Rhodocyclaceae bacterium]
MGAVRGTKFTQYVGVTTPPATTPSAAPPIASLPHLASTVAAPTDVSATHYRQQMNSLP